MDGLRQLFRGFLRIFGFSQIDKPSKDTADDNWCPDFCQVFPASLQQNNPEMAILVKFSYPEEGDSNRRNETKDGGVMSEIFKMMKSCT